MGLFSKKKPHAVIDLRERAAPTSTTTSAPFVFGYPTRCPECGSRGYLDHIDPFRRVQYEHCPSCAAKWELAEDAIQSLNA
jgi:hypothetical protein